jgi:hypothetical protein
LIDKKLSFSPVVITIGDVYAPWLEYAELYGTRLAGYSVDVMAINLPDVFV